MMFERWRWKDSLRAKAAMAVFLLASWALLFSWWATSSMLGQITSPPTVTTSQTESAKDVSHQNVTGVPLKWAMLNGDASLVKETWFEASVDSVIDSTNIILGVAMRYGNISVNRSVTVRTNYDLYLPEEEWDGIPDSLFQICLNDTLRHVKNWKFKLQVKALDGIKLPASKLLLAGDSVNSAADTVVGMAVFAGLGSLSFELTAESADSDSCQAIIGYQVKLPGEDWTGPAGAGSYFIAADSLVLIPGVAKGIPFAPPAAWIRPALIGNSMTGNIKCDSLVARIR